MSNKRQNIFGQGKPEQPYEERLEDDPPKVATAAQLAARKIKAPKSRARTPGASSGGFGQSQPSFSFGAAPSPNNSANAFNFSAQQSTPNFGGNATNSFPPAQAPDQSNNSLFSNSSFPSFGGSNTGTTFNPQPPSSSGFNFTAGQSQANNPFAMSNSESTQSKTTTFGGASSVFNNTIGNHTFTPTKSLQTTTDSSPSNFFAPAVAGSTSNTTTAGEAAGQLFGATSSSQITPFGGSFGSSAQSNPFSGLASTSQSNNTTSTAQNLFSGLNATAKDTTNTTGTSTQNPFGGSLTGAFGSTTQSSSSIFTSTAPPSGGLFGNAPSTAKDTSPAPSGAVSQSNPFSGLSSTSQPANPAPSTGSSSLFFGSTGSTSQQTPSFQSSSSQNAPFSIFGSSAAQGNSLTSTATPQKKDETPSAFKPAPTQEPNTIGSSTPLFNFGQKPTADNTPSATPAFSTQPFGGAPAGSSSLFANTASNSPAPQATPLGQSTSKPSQKSFFSKPEDATFTEPSNLDSAPTSAQLTPSKTPAFKPATPSTGLFSGLGSGSGNQPGSSGLFSKAQPAPQSDKVKNDAPSATPSFLGKAVAEDSRESAKTSQVPSIPKTKVPSAWNESVQSTHSLPAFANSDELNEVDKSLIMYSGELVALNERYRKQLLNLPALADWSGLSRWHSKQSSLITNKIADAKKERARLNGVTGLESTVSKRKGDDGDRHDDGPSTPSKKPRGGDGPSSFQSSLFSQTPQSTPPAKDASQTANTFANILSKSTGSSFGTSTLKSSQDEETAKATAPSTVSNASSAFKPATTFQSSGKEASPFKSNTPQSAGAAPKNDQSTSGFVPSFGVSSNSTNRSAQSGFVPSAAPSNSNFMASFAKSAKTAEQLAKERKAEAKRAQYDSEDSEGETEEEWSSRYDREEAERIEKAEAAKKAASAFTISASGSGATNSVFSSRFGSPAPSATGGQSVFNTPSAAASPSSNIFGHLSSGPSSNNQDDSDDEADEVAETEQEGGADTEDQESNDDGSTASYKPRADESESEESLEESMRRKKQDTNSKGSLLSRITYDSSKETKDSEPENEAASTTPKANGSPFSFFDFSAAAAKSAPPKPAFNVGDNTFKPGTPIKFGASLTESKEGSSTPTFSYQPATPTPAPASNPFANLSKTVGAKSSSLFPTSANPSLPSSAFPSRAVTPLSDAGTSEGGDNENEEGAKEEQVDLSALTSEEQKEYDVLFSAPIAIVKAHDGTEYKTIGRAPLWILQNKESGKALLRQRIPNGQTPVNWYILPSLTSAVVGTSKRMVQIARPAEKKGDKMSPVCITFKEPDTAAEFSSVYDKNLPA